MLSSSIKSSRAYFRSLANRSSLMCTQNLSQHYSQSNQAIEIMYAFVSLYRISLFREAIQENLIWLRSPVALGHTTWSRVHIRFFGHVHHGMVSCTNLSHVHMPVTARDMRYQWALMSAKLQSSTSHIVWTNRNFTVDIRTVRSRVIHNCQQNETIGSHRDMYKRYHGTGARPPGENILKVMEDVN